MSNFKIVTDDHSHPRLNKPAEAKEEESWFHTRTSWENLLSTFSQEWGGGLINLEWTLDPNFLTAVWRGTVRQQYLTELQTLLPSRDHPTTASTRICTQDCPSHEHPGFSRNYWQQTVLKSTRFYSIFYDHEISVHYNKSKIKIVKGTFTPQNLS